MGSPTFVLKTVSTFPLVVEIDTELGKGKLTVDCKPLSRPELQGFPEGSNIDDLFKAVVVAVHGAPGPAGDELEGQEAIDFFINGPLSAYLMPAFSGAYFDQFGDARRKNGQRLQRR